ncbi:hypothetical protein ACFLZV_02005 [Candidatus Margulisiibacteriota bacterium]
MRKKLLVCFFLGFLINSVCFGMGEKISSSEESDWQKSPEFNIQKSDLKNGQIHTIIGILRMAKHISGTKLLLTPLSNFDIHLDIPTFEKAKYEPYQGKFVRVTGKIRIKKMYAPNGKFLHNRYILKVKKFIILKIPTDKYL